MNFSFLMCVNKQHGFLAAAIESVLNQSCKDFDFYIIANNCDDALWSFLEKYAEDTRVRLHRTLVGQLAFNLNYGLNLIGDGYALRMDADDIALPDRLENTKSTLRELGYPDVLGGAAILINERDEETGRVSPPISNSEIRRIIWKKCPFVHPSCAIKVESVLRLGGYLGGFMCEDYDLWIRASRNPKFNFANSTLPFIRYRIAANQTRGNVLAYSEIAGLMVREFLFGGRPLFLGASFLSIAKRYFRGRR